MDAHADIYHLVNKLEIRLNNPVSVLPVTDMSLSDRDWIKLPRFSIDRNQFGHTKITVNFTHISAIIPL